MSDESEALNDIESFSLDEGGPMKDRYECDSCGATYLRHPRHCEYCGDTKFTDLED